MHARCGALANSWACDSQCRTERGHGQKPLSAAATSKAVKQLIAIKQPAGRWDAGQGWAHRDTWCGRRCLWGPRSPTQQGAIVTRLGEPGPPFWPWRGPPRKVGPPTVSVKNRVSDVDVSTGRELYKTLCFTTTLAVFQNVYQYIQTDARNHPPPKGFATDRERNGPS